VPSYLWKRIKKKKMPFRQNVVVAATFLDFQANIFPLLFQTSKFEWCAFCFDLTFLLGVMGFYVS
jgi:hypothetical protein